MGLDDPIPVQVWDFVSGALQGDLGRDFLSRTPVSELILEAFPHTIVLALAALGLATLIGVPLGVYAAMKPSSLLDRITALVSVSLITMPAYIGGLFLLLLFSLHWNVFPAVGAGDFSAPVDYVKHLVLPATALALTWIGYIARLVRTSMLEVLGTNYIRTARAFGLRERLIFYKYALKNAIIPTVAVVSVGLGDLMGGAVFVEVIFSRQGLGRLTVEAIATRNFPIVQGTVLTIALVYVIANLLADLSYRLLDPRIRVEETPAT
jgi:peptide/nickel transport system permease protein